MVVARWTPATVEYLVLSDSALLLESPDGVVTPVLDDRLSLLPRSALATDALVDSTVRNKEGGFFTAAADPSVARRAVTGTVPRHEVRALTALTDGSRPLGGEVRGGRLDGLLPPRTQGGPPGTGGPRTGSGTGGHRQDVPGPEQDT